MTEPLEPEPAPMGPPGDEDDYHLFVEEEGVVVSAEDLFDLPTAAKTLPGMDPVDSAAAMDAFAEDEAVPESTAQAERLREWLTRVALVALSLIIVLGIGLVIRKRSARHDEIADSAPAVEVAPPSVVPLPVKVDPPPVAVAAPPVAVVVPPAPIVAHTETPAPEPRKPARETVMPAIQRTGRERMADIESALAAGRRGFARVELGRLLLDTDALPETEREETRAQAELRLAMLLQDVADEARRMPR